MHSFLKFLTEVLLALGIGIIVSTIVTVLHILFFIDKRRIKPNAPTMMLWTMIGGITVLVITLVLIETGVLPHISLFNNPNLEHYWVESRSIK